MLTQMTQEELTTFDQFVNKLRTQLQVVNKSEVSSFFTKGMQYLNTNFFEKENIYDSSNHSRARCRKDVENALNAVGVSYQRITQGKGVHLHDVYMLEGLCFTAVLGNARRGGKILTFSHINDL